ncbi:MAG: class I SAM-dependent methyltransferase [Caulobacteraceae bacterium]
MDQAFQAVLADYDARMAREEATYGDQLIVGGVPDRDALLLSVGEDVGRMLNLMAKGCGAKAILELGTSYGYSTLWLADAARATGGKVISLELEAYKVDAARAALQRAGLADYVEFHIGNALDILPTLPGPFDFVLLDLWKDLYVPCMELCLPRLTPGGLILADNMLRPAINRPEALTYRRAVRARPELTTVLLPIGQGVEVSRLAGPDDAEL